MAKPIEKNYLLVQLRNFKSVILDPAYIIQKTSLPTASEDYEDKVFQYVGSDSSTYTIGGFYQCQEVTPATIPATYHWVEITSKTSIDDATIKENSSGEIYVPTATAVTLGVVKGSEDVSIDANGGMTVNNRLEKISALPTASDTNVGKIYLLTSNQTSYEKGGVYECQEVAGSDPTEYAWVLISTNPLEAGKGITIENDVISADTNLFSGTKEEYEALSADEKKKYDYLASPETVGGELDVYSTSEVKTNKVWIDGKPIYRKVVDLGNMPNATTKRVAHGITNVSTYISLRGIANIDTTMIFPLPFLSSSNLNITLEIQRTDIVIITDYDRSSASGYAIVEYTKTTD